MANVSKKISLPTMESRIPEELMKLGKSAGLESGVDIGVVQGLRVRALGWKAWGLGSRVKNNTLNPIP